MKGKGFCRRVTAENIDRFRPLLRTAGGPTAGQGVPGPSEPTVPEDPARATAEQLFAGEPVRARPPFQRPASRVPARRARPERGGEPARERGERVSVASLRAGRTVVWKKRLRASDVQRQPGHPTGGVRLSQARFRDPEDPNGGMIDHTTYFRRLLSGFSWHATREEPLVEEAEVPFIIVVRGRSLGAHSLSVSHKPSGEAGQGNYTTMLKWGALAGAVREMNLVGRPLTLYGPRPGHDEPYLIHIS